MLSPPLSTLNLNLLKVFAAIYTTRHLTRAAMELRMTQPAMSHALRRLRAQTGDQLFVRSPQGMMPTIRAEQLAPVILDALRSLDEALSTKPIFDPSRAQRSFRISASDLASIVTLPALVPQLAEEAPGISLVVAQISIGGTDRIFDQLDQGAIDLAIASVPRVPKRFGSAVLFRERAACVVARDHPFIADAPTLEQFLEARHVRILLGEEEETPIDSWLAHRRLARRVAMSTTHLATALRVVAGTDFVASAPLQTSIALAGETDLRFLKHPIALDETSVRMVWHARYDEDPAHAWLRARTQSAASSAITP